MRILDAARDLFAEGGESHVTLRRVADRIEYSATIIYSHFPNKEALVQELCEAEFAFFGRTLHKAAQCSDAMERLRRVALAYVDFGLQHPEQYRFLFVRTRPSAPEREMVAVRDDSNQADAIPASPPHGHLQEAVFKAMAAGCFKPEYRNVDLIAQTIWSCLHGLVTLYLVRAQFAGTGWQPVQSVVELALESLLNGLVTPSNQMAPTWNR